MSQLRHPLDELLKLDAKWIWNNNCEKALTEFKTILQSELLLTHYDPSLPIFVAADASTVGIGAQIFHKMQNGANKVVYHISRTLTATEQKYSQIEKEALALVYACTKFHRMIYGRKFTLLTDHKPLLAIFGSKKGIPTHTANRLQRWALVLMSYDFNIQYVKTTEFGNVDVLSRLIDKQKKHDEEFVVAQVSVENEVSAILQENIKSLPVTFNMIRAATKSDTTLQKVNEYVQHGWPTSAKNLPTDVQAFYNRRDAISSINDCLMYLDRLVIPLKFQRRILKQIHKGHQGSKRMKSLARSYVYWPKIDAQIEDFVKHCSNCASVSKSPTKATLSSWSIPKAPLERVHIDIAGPVRGKYYLVIVDAYSKWPEVVQSTTISSKEILNRLHEFISRYGQPKTLVSDNGTQFTSAIFKQFCAERGITQIFSPAYHPQSNGQAERFVDTIKTALSKAYDQYNADDHYNLFLFLSQYRATPNENAPDRKSPAECFIGRKLSTPSIS